MEDKFKIVKAIVGCYAARGEDGHVEQIHAAVVTPGLTRFAMETEHGGENGNLVFTGDEIIQLKRDLGYSPDETILPQALKNVTAGLFEREKGKIAKLVEEAREA